MQYVTKCLILISFVFATQLSWAQGKTVKLAYVDYPPYYGEKLLNKGPFSEIIIAAFEHSGVKVELQFMPWNRALKWTEEGKFDGLYTAWYRADREQSFAFSDPLPPNEIVLFKHKSTQVNYSSFSDLKPYKIGVVRGYSNPKGFDDAGLSVQEVKSDKQNIIKLSRGYIDMALIDKALARYLIRKEIPEYENKLDWIEPPLEVTDQYVMFSKNVENYASNVDLFNAGLKAIQSSGHLEQILKKHKY